MERVTQNCESIIEVELSRVKEAKMDLKHNSTQKLANSEVEIARNTEIIPKPLSLSYLERPLKQTESLTNLLLEVYRKQRQSEPVYKLKAELRQKIYSLLTQSMTERVDLYLIGSSLTGFGSNSSDTDLCLVIYDSKGAVDKKYEDKFNSILKLHEISEILHLNGISINTQVIPALVPILKFSDKSSGIEVNINLNRIVTIRNTHLLHTYSLIDWRVSPLILCIKLWARKNGINCAFNKSLTSYSISLMVIYYLQSVCNPPIVPCLQKQWPKSFSNDVTQLRLGDVSMIQFISGNDQSLGQLFTKFMRYYSLEFPFSKVISVRSGSLIDRSLFIGENESAGKVWQWKCHICIEEPFDNSNTSHAVHDCKIFRHILYSFMKTFQEIKNKMIKIDNFV